MGLMNQHLSIVNFLTLGIVVGANELVVTAARSRTNFSASASWEVRDVSEIWNVTKIANFMSDMLPGLHCAAQCMCAFSACGCSKAKLQHHTCSLLRAGRGIAFIPGNATDDCVFHLAYIGLDWQNPSEFGDVADFVRRKIKQQLIQAPVEQLKSGHTVQVAVHCLLTSTISLHSRIHSEVARHFTFTDTLHALASKAVARLRAETGIPAFNGVHLRIEDDFSHVTDAGAGARGRLNMQLVWCNHDFCMGSGHCWSQIARACSPSMQRHSSEPSWTLRYLCMLLAESFRHSPSLHRSGDTALLPKTCIRSSCWAHQSYLLCTRSRGPLWISWCLCRQRGLLGSRYPAFHSLLPSTGKCTALHQNTIT